MKELSVDEFIKKNDAVAVDVRSPIEFAEGSIPKARNIPLFTNGEREEIGTIYKKEGPAAAKWRAMEVVAPKIPALLSEIRKVKESGKEPVLYCWRGGSRSQSMAAFAALSGLEVPRIVGGYRAYRERILEKIPQMLHGKAIVLHGMTGVGKTQILDKLKEKGYPILDLEKFANHRGSVFGSFGQGDAHNQKTFDALLFEELSQIGTSDYFIMEAESKRIGRATQPDALLTAKEEGIHISVDASMEKRTRRIYEEYILPYKDQPWFKDKVWESIHKIEKKIKNKESLQSLYHAIEAENYEKVINVLFVDYYDPRYSHKENSYEGEFFYVNADSIADAAAEIEKIIENAGFAAPATLNS
ncbi:tRNA 2-selenouridine(34) synthase MnmH [Peribacillus glennii]|uniref:tRNA 2-selenouridine(34) synthase MnmH n=1 Tax=Peribacillus glennii TaxID=2303991 RepID=A0A372LGG3_9BACI|nr:tRNA 2-selenouridine(34) synthase MnmH [Peribacillus glennii]RFU65391.1 tRNA 2-selenouridine(34) synthase MnmH [Peribacillus glennii]